MRERFINRSQAAEVAQRLGWAAFRTTFEPGDDLWKATYEPGDNPAAEFAKNNDFVHHGEVAWIADHDDAPRKRVNVLVVNVTLDELREEGTVTTDKHGLWLDAKWLVEPLVTELWDVPKTTRDPVTGVKTRAPREPNASRPQGGTRERSTIKSPTKLVWAKADEMAGASRKDVIAACVELGVHPSTAATQYYRWNAVKNPK